MSKQHQRVMNLKYKTKYKAIKRHMKNLIFENAALCDEVAQVQSDLLLAREERRFLLKMVMRYEGIELIEKSDTENDKKAQKQNTISTAATSSGITSDNSDVNQQPTKKKAQRKRKQKVDGTDEKVTNKISKKGKNREKTGADVKKYPINLFNILIYSPGEIIPVNPNFHTSNWIYPVGYVATRLYAHPRDPQRKCVFTCKILNNAGTPHFQIIPDNDLDSVFFGTTADSCHKSLLENIQRSLSSVVQLPINIQGEKFFGLANATVKSLLQLDPGFKECEHFKEFPPDDDMSLPEDKDPTMSYDALQSLIALSANHTIKELKEEPPDELLNII